jgi:hypothetical protein
LSGLQTRRSPGAFWDIRGFAVFLDRAKEERQHA